MVIDANDNVFVTGTAINGLNADFQTLGYAPSGDLFTQVSYNGHDNLNDRPDAITIDLEGDIIVVGQTEAPGGLLKNRTVKYGRYEKPFEPVLVGGVPSHNKGEVIIRFDRSSVIHSVIDKKEFEAGYLSDFITQDAMTAINNKMQKDFSRFETYKIFRRMTTADTISVTRLGDTIKVEDFWATLSVIFPDSYDENEIVDSLNTMGDTIIHFAHLNGIIERHDVPNDILISTDQAGLFPTTTYPNAHINIEPAWDIEVGQWYTKVGVFDEPIYWAHEDFGDGTYNGSKIKGGWDYFNNIHISGVLSPGSSHGTSCAGIIGALRNNNKGIAGIAGGDVDNFGNTGAQLFSMGLFSSEAFSSNSIAAAIVEGATYNPNTGYGYGLNIQNHSWGSASYDQIIDNAVNTAWRNHCIFVASRGNGGLSGNPINYPACLADVKVLNTGASGFDGEHKDMNNGDLFEPWESSYGNNIDFNAPGCTEIVSAPYNPISPYTWTNSLTEPGYFTFMGTSAAAPHVTGVAALMYSKHHINNGAPNNLATEDVEYILQKNATDKGTSGYDQYNGWGLINAAASLEKVNFPAYYIKHSPHATPTTSTSTNISVIISNNTDGIAAGQYIADRIQLNWTYVDVLPVSDEILDWWSLQAKTYMGVSAANPITGTRWMNVTPSVTLGGNAAVFSVQTFAWWVKTSINGQTVNKWIPSGGPSTLKYAYSLHVRNMSIGGIDDIENPLDINLYPNPTNENINITLSLSESTNTILEIYDAQGKLVATPNLGNKAQGEHNLSINVSNLQSGLYLLKIIAGENTVTKRFIKQ